MRYVLIFSIFILAGRLWAEDFNPFAKDYFERLAISQDATNSQVHRAYRLAARIYHPNNIRTGNRKKFDAIVTAYEALETREKRLHYLSSTRSEFKFPTLPKIDPSLYGPQDLIGRELERIKLSQFSSKLTRRLEEQALDISLKLKTQAQAITYISLLRAKIIFKESFSPNFELELIRISQTSPLLKNYITQMGNYNINQPSLRASQHLKKAMPSSLNSRLKTIVKTIKKLEGKNILAALNTFSEKANNIYDIAVLDLAINKVKKVHTKFDYLYFQNLLNFSGQVLAGTNSLSYFNQEATPRYMINEDAPLSVLEKRVTNFEVLNFLYAHVGRINNKEQAQEMFEDILTIKNKGSFVKFKIQHSENILSKGCSISTFWFLKYISG